MKKQHLYFAIKKNSIKVLCYDKNGFILAKKKLLDKEKRNNHSTN